MALKHRVPFFLILVLAGLALFLPGHEVAHSDSFTYDTGDTAWMLMSTALVLIMTPGLAFFYGGMVRKKNVISTMLQSFVSMAVITVLWGVVGFSLAFR
ncbi:MAG TPA: ammonia channel protein, partial [Cryomorphaceae bacterium]|nr:ammonia channel protein [Cryomorphaceae bacterium]